MKIYLLTRPLILATMAFVAVPRGAAAQQPSPDALITVEVATVGIGLVTRMPVVILHDPVSDKTMPVWIGTAEAEAIARALFKVKSPRPMTHDLLADLVKAMDGTLEEVVITDSKDGVYFGHLHIRNKEKKLVDVDTRPSDGVALALRTGAPIRVARKLLETAPEVAVQPDPDSPDFARALGLTVVSATDKLRQTFKLPSRDGVIVTESLDEAAEAGIQAGDLIVEVNGKAPKTAQVFWEEVRKAHTAGTIQMKYWRDGKEKEVRVRVRRPGGEPTPAVPA
jgi:bifunctional DNase/RNase